MSNNFNDILVELEFTPNPDTLKYKTNQTLLKSAAANFPTRESAKGKSPLAEELFAFPEISAVMVGRDFVTITVKNQDTLQKLNENVITCIRSFLASGAEAVAPQTPASSEALSEIEQKIVKILDEEIRPAVAQDGGDISFEKFEDGFVYLRMQGACSGCPSSMMTLKMGVETRLRESIPEVQEVIPV